MRTPEQIASEAAEKLTPDLTFYGDIPPNDKTLAMYQQLRALDIERATQIILAAIHEALKVEWVDEPPTVPGWYWWRKYPSWKDSHRCVQVVQQGETLYSEGWSVKMQGGQWSNKPIQEPE